MWLVIYASQINDVWEQYFDQRNDEIRKAEAEASKTEPDSRSEDSGSKGESPFNGFTGGSPRGGSRPFESTSRPTSDSDTGRGKKSHTNE